MSRAVVATIAACLALALAAAPAGAKPYLPPAGHLFAGLGGVETAGQFTSEVGKHQAVFQVFGSWNERVDRMLAFAQGHRMRLMIHVSTQIGNQELITPGQIARGQGDGWLRYLNGALAASGQVVYIRLMAEMDGYWNHYCAFSADGRSRGADHSTATFRRAWRRTVLIVRGGPVAQIDQRLHKLGMPPVRGAASALPQPKVAFLWVPQVAGAPDTRANAPSAYWPGGAYVDWVGTDFYSKYPNWSGLDSFFGQFRGKPFAFGEWALWGSDNPGFVSQLFGWVRSHRSVRMLIYNQGQTPGGIFSLSRYPRSAQALRRELSSGKFAPYAAELTP